MITLKKSLLTQKQLKNLSIHPLAMPAYQMWIDLKKQTSIINLPHSLQKLLIETTPLLVVDKKMNRNQLDELFVFGGFQYLHYLSHSSVLDGNAYRYQKIEKYPSTHSSSTIEQQALATFLSVIPSQFSSKTGNGHLYRMLQKNDFAESIIGHPSPSREKLSKWLNVGSSKIKHQASKSKKEGVK